MPRRSSSLSLFHASSSLGRALDVPPPPPSLAPHDQAHRRRSRPRRPRLGSVVTSPLVPPPVEGANDVDVCSAAAFAYTPRMRGARRKRQGAEGDYFRHAIPGEYPVETPALEEDEGSGGSRMMARMVNELGSGDDLMPLSTPEALEHLGADTSPQRATSPAASTNGVTPQYDARTLAAIETELAAASNTSLLLPPESAKAMLGHTDKLFVTGFLSPTPYIKSQKPSPSEQLHDARRITTQRAPNSFDSTMSDTESMMHHGEYSPDDRGDWELVNPALPRPAMPWPMASEHLAVDFHSVTPKSGASVSSRLGLERPSGSVNSDELHTEATDTGLPSGIVSLPSQPADHTSPSSSQLAPGISHNPTLPPKSSNLKMHVQDTPVVERDVWVVPSNCPAMSPVSAAPKKFVVVPPVEECTICPNHGDNSSHIPSRNPEMLVTPSDLGTVLPDVAHIKGSPATDSTPSALQQGGSFENSRPSPTSTSSSRDYPKGEYEDCMAPRGVSAVLQSAPVADHEKGLGSASPSLDHQAAFAPSTMGHPLAPASKTEVFDNQLYVSKSSTGRPEVKRWFTALESHVGNVDGPFEDEHGIDPGHCVRFYHPEVSETTTQLELTDDSDSPGIDSDLSPVPQKSNESIKGIDSTSTGSTITIVPGSPTLVRRNNSLSGIGTMLPNRSIEVSDTNLPRNSSVSTEGSPFDSVPSTSSAKASGLEMVGLGYGRHAMIDSKDFTVIPNKDGAYDHQIGDGLKVYADQDAHRPKSPVHHVDWEHLRHNVAKEGPKKYHIMEMSNKRNLVHGTQDVSVSPVTDPMAKSVPSSPTRSADSHLMPYSSVLGDDRSTINTPDDDTGTLKAISSGENPPTRTLYPRGGVVHSTSTILSLSVYSTDVASTPGPIASLIFLMSFQLVIPCVSPTTSFTFLSCCFATGTFTLAKTRPRRVVQARDELQRKDTRDSVQSWIDQQNGHAQHRKGISKGKEHDSVWEYASEAQYHSGRTGGGLDGIDEEVSEEGMRGQSRYGDALRRKELERLRRQLGRAGVGVRPVSGVGMSPATSIAG